ncbi:MAG: UPF0058 family protein [Candidatus Nanohaloarchaea archaeon]|nr:UPF0058 family protein [Candidatus Nanohaloarchaea archaeon]
MKEQGLIHLHALVHEAAEYADERADHDRFADRPDRYTALDIRPTSVHRSKDRQKAGLYALSLHVTGVMGADTSGSTLYGHVHDTLQEMYGDRHWHEDGFDLEADDPAALVDWLLDDEDGSGGDPGPDPGGDAREEALQELEELGLRADD